MTLAVEVEDVFRVYATDEGTAAALQGLSLTVHEGEVVAVLGPSGSGKTTLLRILAGLDRPSAGRVRVAGVDLRRLRGRGLDRYRSRRLGYADQRYTQALAPELTAGELVSLRLALVAQEPPLVPFLSVRENVELFLGLRGLDGGNGQAQKTLAVVGLEQLMEQRVSRLSTGEQERVAIARALASEPNLLLADEPTARLDYANALAIGELLSRIARERGIAVVCATHDPAVIEQADAELSLV